MTAPQISMRDKIFIAGGFRSGKTTFAKYLASKFVKVAAFDPVHELGGVGQVSHTVPDAWNVWRQSGKSVLQPIDAKGSFEPWCGEALKASNSALLIDELNQFCTAYSMPPAFSNLVRLCHKRNCALILVTHRLGDAPRITRYVEHRFYFRMDEWSEVQALEGLIGPEAAQQIATLPPYHAMYFGPGIQGVLKPCPT